MEGLETEPTGRIGDECIPGIQEFVKTCANCQEAWFGLRGQYKTTGWSLRYGIVRDLLFNALNSCNDSVEAYVDKFLNHTNRLIE